MRGNMLLFESLLRTLPNASQPITLLVRGRALSCEAAALSLFAVYADFVLPFCVSRACYNTLSWVVTPDALRQLLSSSSL